ncbi:MAG: hypothetical protein HWE12_15130 [Oceanospirillaceae bacterium]|nr:hypothetical protein [Oceanospirillaceae bacterium]
MLDHTNKNWVLSGASFSFDIACPDYFVVILQQTLNGWGVSRGLEERPPQIRVQRTEDRYSIDAQVMAKPIVDSSIINILNEFFVVLAYQCCNADERAELLHCGSYRDGEKNFIVVGEKNSGKSTKMLQSALNGLEVLADDLLLWYPSSGEFVAVGLPLRLRRPVLNLEGAELAAEMFFASESIAYSKRDVFKIAPVGETFLLDELLVLSEAYSFQRVSLLKTTAKLREHLIGLDYTSVKRERLDSHHG